MKKWLALILLIMVCFMSAGCWNYREVDSLSIVTGVGVDRDPGNGELVLSVEIITPSGGAENETETKIIEARGKTVFDAIRNAINILGRRLFWQHSHIIVIGEEAAKQGILDLLDFFYRDAESRLTTRLMVAKGVSAKDIMTSKGISESILSYGIDKRLENKKSIEKYPLVELYQAVQMLKFDVPCLYLPCIEIKEQQDEKLTQICGTAIFQGDKLKGHLDMEDSKYFLYVIDEIKGGLLVNPNALNNPKANISLEVFDSKTKVKPTYQEGKVAVSIDIKTEAAIAESGPDVNFMDKSGETALKDDMQGFLEQNITRVIRKVQKEFGVDIFGFGKRIYQDMPDVWKEYKDGWDTVGFKELEFTVSSEIKIRNTAVIGKSLRGVE